MTAWRKACEFAVATGLGLTSVPALSQDPATLVDEAVAAREAGDHATAIARLEQAAELAPRDATVLRLLGTSQAFAGQHHDAIETLRRARSLSPDDLDIRAALARAYLWSGRVEAARSEVAHMTALAPENAEAAAIAGQISRARTARSGMSGAFFVGQSVADISLDSGAGRTWLETTLGGFVRWEDGTALSAQVQRFDREIAIDTNLQLRADAALSDTVRGHVALSATPNADFREQWAVRSGVEADVAPFATLLADARYAQYAPGDTLAVEPGLRVSIGEGQASLTGRMINLWDVEGTHRVGWSARVDVPVPGGSQLFAGGATYPDTEAGVTRTVRSAFAGAAIRVSDRVMLRLIGEYDRRRTSYRRSAVYAGLTLGF